MSVNRQGATSAGGPGYNRGGGIDAEFNLTDHYQLKVFLMGTATPGRAVQFAIRPIDSRFENDLWRFIRDPTWNRNPTGKLYLQSATSFVYQR